MTTNNTPRPGANDVRNANVPDISRYLALHRAIRVANCQLVDALSAVPEPRHDRATATSLSRWFAGYRGELHDHHELEDDLFFPALAARVPSFAEYSATLNTDHHRLDELIAALRDTLARMAAGASSRAADWTEALSHAVEFRDLMAEHLDFEDADVLPMFERHFSVAEYAVLDEQSLKHVRLRQALFTVPWFMATVDPETAAQTLLDAPTPLKVVYRLTRNRYARLVRAAFGHVVDRAAPKAVPS